VGDLLALPRHDFGELVGHKGKTEHAVVTEDKAEKFSVYLAGAAG
jgi:hypothetical protein